MKQDSKYDGQRRKNPLRGFGVFLISLGVFLLAGMLDLLSLGDPREYFRWEMILIFFGLWSLFDGKIIGAIGATSVGVWFLLDDLLIDLPPFVETLYWPGVIILIGLAFIVSSFSRRLRNIV